MTSDLILEPPAEEKIAAPAQTARERDWEAAAKFIERLRKECRDTGRSSSLRRAAGESLADARNILWFYAIRGQGHERWEEGVAFLVATLFAGDKNALSGKSKFRGDMGATLARIKARSGSSPEAVERRLRLLLDADMEWDGGGEMIFRLRQTVRWTLAQGGEIDWPQLLVDLSRWNSPYRTTQKNWAHSFFASESIEDTDTTTAPATDDNDE